MTATTNGTSHGVDLDLDALHRLRSEVDAAARRTVGFAGLRWKLPPSLPLGVAVDVNEGRFVSGITPLVEDPVWTDEPNREPPTVDDAIAHLLKSGFDVADLETIVESYGTPSGESSVSSRFSRREGTNSPPTSPGSTVSTSPAPHSIP